jgi:hypothetical protein
MCYTCPILFWNVELILISANFASYQYYVKIMSKKVKNRLVCVVKGVPSVKWALHLDAPNVKSTLHLVQKMELDV